MDCIVCLKPLIKNQKKMCSISCRTEYLRQINTGRVSPFKGMTNRYTEDQKRQIGDAQRGKPKSADFIQKCSDRRKGKPSFMLGKKHTEASKQKMSEKHRGEDGPHWKGKYSTGANKIQYSVNLRREKFGFTKELFDTTLAAQAGCCAICGILLNDGVPTHAACADHCHVTNTPRGILCKHCNSMLGQAKDNIESLQKAIEYLEKYST